MLVFRVCVLSIQKLSFKAFLVPGVEADRLKIWDIAVVLETRLLLFSSFYFNKSNVFLMFLKCINSLKLEFLKNNIEKNVLLGNKKRI